MNKSFITLRPDALVCLISRYTVDNKSMNSFNIVSILFIYLFVYLFILSEDSKSLLQTLSTDN